MQPFQLLSPGDDSVPVLYDSPHSGRSYPADFGSSASLAELRRGEDAWVDELIADAHALGITVLLAVVPRCLSQAARAPSKSSF